MNVPAFLYGRTARAMMFRTNSPFTVQAKEAEDTDERRIENA